MSINEDFLKNGDIEVASFESYRVFPILHYYIPSSPSYFFYKVIKDAENWKRRQ